MSGKILNYFPGGNTSEGFYSFYNYILSQKDAKRIICIKGGPGTGKSSLMKKIGNFFNERGYDIELHHCSSDNNSLDGVVIKNLKVAILDGTAPHVVDPKNPGAVDEVLNMGDCWREDGFAPFREEIIKHNIKISELFQSAYRFLGAAKKIYDDIEYLNDRNYDDFKVNKFVEGLVEKCLPYKYTNLGYERHIFEAAFTPNGKVYYIKDLMKDYNDIYCLNGCSSSYRSNILKHIGNEAIKMGFYVEFLHNPLIPSEIHHILIPELSLCFVSSNEMNECSLEGKQIYLESLYKDTIIMEKDRINKDKELYNSLIEGAINNIKNAKELHDHMETYYIPNMDFKKIDLVYEKTINKILSYE